MRSLLKGKNFSRSQRPPTQGGDPADLQPPGPYSATRRRGVFATIRDISTTGVGLVVSERFPVGAVLVAEPLKKGPRTLLARVVRSCKVEGGWLHGCELSPQLRDADLFLWLNREIA